VSEMTRPTVHVKTGDTVQVIRGKNKGRKGKVLRVIPAENRVVVEGVNMVKRHRRPTGQMMQGGIIDQEAPLDASKVMLVCNACGRPTRSGRRFLEDGRKVRVCGRCGEVIDR